MHIHKHTFSYKHGSIRRAQSHLDWNILTRVTYINISKKTHFHTHIYICVYYRGNICTYMQMLYKDFAYTNSTLWGILDICFQPN